MVQKANKMEAKIYTLENWISDISRVLEEKLSDIEKKMEGSINNDFDFEKINTVEKKYICS